MTTKTIGDYSLIKEIGESSLGSSYLAEHRFLKKNYVLNLLADELTSTSGFITKLEQEVAALASFDHANLVKIHNVSIADDRYFLVSHCFANEEAESIKGFLQSHGKKLSDDEIFNILGQIAAALDFLHEQSIGGSPVAHLSLNLNNVWISSSGEGLKVALADYGLAKMIGFNHVLSYHCYKLTTAHSRSFAENYAFWAPEIRYEKPGHMKADAYAFGILAYYLLMREFPEGFFELPSAREVSSLYAWDHLLYRCLQADPLKRPVSLKKAIDEIQNSNSTHVQGKVHIQRWEASKLTSLSTATSKEQTLKPFLKPQELTKPEFIADPGAIFQTEPSVGRYIPEQEKQESIEPILTEMAVIPGGDYFRGSNQGGRDEIPRHRVKLRSFAIDVHPVTNEQFVRFLEAQGGEKDALNNDIIRLREARIKRSLGKLVIESGYAKHPVVGVSWYGAIAYAKWIGKRLPTEAEWEVAAYGGVEDSLYPSGNEIERSQANFFSSDTTPVMSYPPNEYGIFDMAGNVYEWCHDWYDYHYYDVSAQEPDHPQGPLQGVYRVLRGGCWKSLKEDLRCAHRHRNNPGTINSTYGFRCAADVVQEN